MPSLRRTLVAVMTRRQSGPGMPGPVTHLHIEHFHADAERHGEVDVTLGNMELQNVGNQCRAHQHLKEQSQHLQRRGIGNETTAGIGKQHHETHRADLGYLHQSTDRPR